MAARHGDLSKVTLHDVDAFISYQWSKKCCASTIVAYCQGLRSFFAYAEERGWCANRVAEGILSPRLSKYRSGHIAPTWVEVNKLLRLVQTRSALDLRAKAIILLLAIYGLRSSEVRDLRHSDFDWRSETFCVRRVKRGGMQQFPIQWKVGQAILRYLQYGRPEGDFPHLFLSTRKPYRPLGRGAMWEIIGPKMRRVGIETKHIGPHTLRHACASQLLKKGFSMHEIAEFLGHRDIRSVGVYARYDTRMLNRVAAFNLRGLL
jgi:site-specific recombinase XerD